MSPALPREERDAIRARVEAATPGPWAVDQNHGDIVIRPDLHDDDDERWVAEAWNGRSDAEFIAHARTDAPALLDALDAAEEENERLRGEVERAHQAMTLSEGEVADIIAEGIRQKGRANAARAEVAALRGRIEALADEWERTTTQSLAASGYTYSLPMRDVLTRLRRALAADEGERTGR